MRAPHRRLRRPSDTRCEPCRNGHHIECEHSLGEDCDCLVCVGEHIGDRVLETNASRIRHDERDELEVDVSDG